MNLNNLSKEELIQMIESLVDESNIEAYISNTFESSKVQKLKKELEETFFPTMGMPYISLPEVDGKLEEFEKDSASHSIVEIELYYIETIIEFTQSYGVMGNDFYEHMIKAFEKVIQNLDGSHEFDGKIDYLMGCMMYMNEDVYRKMVAIKESN